MDKTHYNINKGNRPLTRILFLISTSLILHHTFILTQTLRSEMLEHTLVTWLTRYDEAKQIEILYILQKPPPSRFNLMKAFSKGIIILSNACEGFCQRFILLLHKLLLLLQNLPLRKNIYSTVYHHLFKILPKITCFSYYCILLLFLLC